MVGRVGQPIPKEQSATWAIIAVVEKKKVVEKGRKVGPSEIVDEDVKEDVLPLKRKAGKSKDVGTFEASEVIIPASPVERLAAKATQKSKKVKEGLRRLKEDTQSFIAAKRLGREIREGNIVRRARCQRSRRAPLHRRSGQGI